MAVLIEKFPTRIPGSTPSVANKLSQLKSYLVPCSNNKKRQRIWQFCTCWSTPFIFGRCAVYAFILSRLEMITNLFVGWFSLICACLGYQCPKPASQPSFGANFPLDSFFSLLSYSLIRFIYWEAALASPGNDLTVAGLFSLWFRRSRCPFLDLE